MVRKLKSRNKTNKDKLLEEKKQLQKEIDEIKARQEENRKRLGITLEEEQKIIEYVEQNKNKNISDEILFNKIYRQILEERKQQQIQKKQEREKQLKAIALKEVQRPNKKKKLSDNKTFSINIRVSEKEKAIIDILKAKGIDISHEVRKAILKLDREVTHDILADDAQELKSRLRKIKKDLKIHEINIDALREQEKTEETFINIEKEKYIITDLKKDKARTEKILHEFKSYL